MWEDVHALMLFKVVTTEKQLDINVDKNSLNMAASEASLGQKKSRAEQKKSRAEMELRGTVETPGRENGAGSKL
jgi:hypothetical protein